MASTLRFDNWEDSNGTPILDGTNLALPSSALPAGSVLQVVSSTKTNTFTQTTTAFTDIPDLSVSITPSSTSNKVLVFAVVNVSSASSSNVAIRLERNGSAIGGPSGSSNGLDGFWMSNVGITDDRIIMPGNINYLDSPSSTSSVTYNVALGGDNVAPNYVNRRANSASYLTSSHITAMEIAG